MKFRLILVLGMTLCLLAACGDTEIPTETDYNQTMVNIGKDMKENAQGTMDIVNNASYSSFDEVYNDSMPVTKAWVDEYEKVYNSHHESLKYSSLIY